VSYPDKPDAAYDYSAYQEAHPASPPPGDQMDIDYANLKASVDALVDWIISTFTSEAVLKPGAMPTGEDLTAYVETATEAATSATASATAAATSATNAAASAVAAAATAGTILATSTSSVAIGTGSKSFTTQTAKNFGAGQWATLASAADVSNFMFGQVTAYNSGTGALTVNVTSVGGSGTKADWNISLSGIQGATGATGATGPAGAGGTDATGVVKFFSGRIADMPSGWLPLNGATGLLRATYPDLVAAWIKSSTFTITIASPAVVSKTGHGLDDGDPWVASTDGALPTGITAGTTYYVKAVNANSFQLTDVPGGTVVNTSGSQSGTHTYVSALCSVGDGSTTFDMPDWRGTSPIGHDMMGSTAAGNLTNASHGIYGRKNGTIGGANADTVVNTSHAHGTGAARVTGTTTFNAYGSPVGGDQPTQQYTAISSIDNAGSGATSAAGTGGAAYKRIGRVAVGIWMVKT
jgi:hypothetical protein